ncbi:MAG: hypothetical protein J6Y02_17230 [Pseudobutyrivibrio sp.]|nr:hypothetical protein [Pseudobutyrivibrio sp.]
MRKLMTILERLQNKLSDDISFLKRKDVSWRFKILNLISGDRLRLEMAINCMNADQSIEWLDEFYKFIEKYPDTSKEDLVSYMKACDWRIRGMKKDLWDIWEI